MQHRHISYLLKLRQRVRHREETFLVFEHFVLLNFHWSIIYQIRSTILNEREYNLWHTEFKERLRKHPKFQEKPGSKLTFETVIIVSFMYVSV